VIREAKFIQGHQPYAVDLGSLQVTERVDRTGSGAGYFRAEVRAVWFRRKRPRGGAMILTQACAGWLWDFQDSEPADAKAFLAAHADGRYGGDCQARWDGMTLWAPGSAEDQRADYLAVLEPMLKAYPACPDAWDGWWTFRGC
jgi:hypothetical protein